MKATAPFAYLVGMRTLRMTWFMYEQRPPCIS